MGIKKLAKLSGYTYSTLKWYSEMKILPYEQDGSESTRIYNVDVCLELLKAVSGLKKQGLSLAQIQRKLALRQG